LDQKPTTQIRSSGRADATDKQGQGISEPGRADQPGPGAETWVRGREERRLDLNQTATIRSARVSSTLSDLGRTTKIYRQGADMGAVAPLGPAAGIRRRQEDRPRRGTRGLGDWPRRAQGDLADSAKGTTSAREHQRALHTARRANSGTGQLRRAIAC
jgi:hypothetical protein